MKHYHFYNTKDRIEALARQWLDDHRMRRDFSEASEDVMVLTSLGSLEQNIELITAMLNQADEDSDLIAIATAVGEKLMSKHGAEAIDWFVRAVENDPQFKTMARYMWQVDIHEDIWRRVQHAISC